MEVPLIVTGHSHTDHERVMKEIAAAARAETFSLNWVEQDNYRTIRRRAVGYGHTSWRRAHPT